MKIAGDFNAYNALAAYTVLRELGSMMSLFELVSNHILQIMVVCNISNLIIKSMINLAKNPAGMNASLSVGEQLVGKKYMSLV